MAGALNDPGITDADLQDALDAQQSAGGGALSSDSYDLPAPKEEINPEDVDTRKQILENATKRILQQRQLMQQAPYGGADLGMLGEADNYLQGPSWAGLRGAGMARAEGMEKMRQAKLANIQAQGGLDLQEAMAKIMGSGMSEDQKRQAMFDVGAMSGNKDIMGGIAEMSRAQHYGMANRAVTVLNEQGKPEMMSAAEAAQRGLAPITRDQYGNILNGNAGAAGMTGGASDHEKAAQDMLNEEGIPMVPVASRELLARSKQDTDYKKASDANKAALQALEALNAQTGKYTPGGGAQKLYAAENFIGKPSKEAQARTEAEKQAKALSNAFMQANVGARGAGIRMVEFDQGAVPNADMGDDARTNLINENIAKAKQNIERAAISQAYPRLSTQNVNALMDIYERNNPPILPNGTPNPKWMTYHDWVKAGRPNTALDALNPDSGGEQGAQSQDASSGASQEYKTKEDIGNAYKAGRITREKAKELLKEHGIH